jgi:hypothetical protein
MENLWDQSEDGGKEVPQTGKNEEEIQRFTVGAGVLILPSHLNPARGGFEIQCPIRRLMRPSAM